MSKTQAHEQPVPTQQGVLAKLLHDRTFVGLVGGLVAIWTLHALLMRSLSADAFAEFRNDTWWPNAPYMTVAQPGLLLMMFGHVMLTFVGGIFVGVAASGVLGLLHRAGVPDLRRYASSIVFVAMLVYGFLLLRGVPSTVTEFDAATRTVKIRGFEPLTFRPHPTRVVRGSEVRAIGIRIGKYAKWRPESDVVARVYLLAHADEPLLIGLRLCPAGSPQTCLDATDSSARALLTLLGRGAPTVTTGADGRSRVFGPPPLVEQ